MKRLHVHVCVENLAESMRFYSALFAVGPTVAKPDYAKWMLDDPRVHFTISQRGAALGLNHLGVQAESADELAEMRKRLYALQTDVTEEAGAACCYAKSDKYWVNDPQGIAWETFYTLDTIPVFGDEQEKKRSSESGCCVPLSKADNTSSCCVPTRNTQAAAGACC